MNPVFYPGFGMEKYLADRSYALIYRMCQVQAFSSRLHARGFPAIGKYEPKTPPRTAGVTKCAIGFGRYSGLARRFCRERPIRAARGIRFASSLSFFRRVAGIAARRGLSSETERCGPEDRCVRMPNRPGMPAPVRSGNRPASARAAASSIAGGGILFR